ncbi:MAG: PHP domain-containing protein [Cyanobacteria bacterium P01_A01_bin.105]
MAAHSTQESASRAVTQEAKALRTVFQSVEINSCPQTYNFHMHTRCSDGKLPPEDLMAQALEIGLQGLAVTDHHTLAGYRQARRWMEDWRWRHPSAWRSARNRQRLPHLWAGVEITAALLGTEVHILGYAFYTDHAALEPYLDHGPPQGSDKEAARVIDAIQAAGGLAVLAHPARYRVSPEQLIPAAAQLGIDGAEVYYAYDNPKPWRPTPEKTARVKTLVNQHQLLGTCGTDTHGLNLTRRL